MPSKSVAHIGAIETLQPDNENAESKNAHYIGHRSRLKERFLSAPSEVADYELLELLLFSAIPRKDVKPLAKVLLQVFQNLNAVLNADIPKLLTIEGVTDAVCANLLMVREFMQRSLKQKVMHKNIINSWNALLDYLRASMGSMKVEQFRVLFLNTKNILIADEVLSVGTIDQTSVYPREIVKRSLFHEAAAIVLVHNHPSGNCKPSNADIDWTAKIVAACSTINVTVHDHVIIANNDYYSFKTNMLL